MARSRLVVIALLSSAPQAACSFTGLGSYDVASCKEAVGDVTNQLIPAGFSGDAQFSIAPGSDAVAAFLGSNPACVQIAVESETATSDLATTCVISDYYSPLQPYAMRVGEGFTVVAVDTSGTTNPGELVINSYAQSMAVAMTGLSTLKDDAGAALPSIALTSDGTHGWVAWYAAPYTNRKSPIESCVPAVGAPLLVDLASSVDGADPTLAASYVQLASNAVSVRPPGITPGLVSGEPALLVASPDDSDAVSIWSLPGTMAPSTQAVATVPLKGARAVSIATDSGDNIAVVAEIGCEPQSIALSFGTLSGGFSDAITVAPAGDSDVVQVAPSVTWSANEGYWIVSWTSNAGGPHALVQRFDTAGKPFGTTLNTEVGLTGAVVTPAGTLYGSSSDNTIETVGVGCALGPGGNEAAQE